MRPVPDHAASQFGKALCCSALCTAGRSRGGGCHITNAAGQRHFSKHTRRPHSFCNSCCESIFGPFLLLIKSDLMVNMIKVPAGMFSVDRSLPINYLGPSAFILEEAISKNGFWFKIKAGPSSKPQLYDRMSRT